MSSPSMPPPKSSSRRPKSANARKSSFSPAAKKRTPRPSGGGGSVPKATSPTSGSLPFSMNPDAHLSREEMQQSHQQSMGLVPTDPSPVSTRQEQNTKGAFSALVHIRHSTMREWICQPHPPTLLSSLMGKGAMEEDDLRFVVAPSREGGHRLLATSCLRLIKEEVSRVQGTTSKDATTQQEQREKEVHWVAGTMESTPMMTITDPISYSSRRWAYHSTQFLLSIDIGKRSSIYLSIASTRGSRWVELRDELIEFFSGPLLWWVDACYSRNWTSDAIGGLKQLRRVLQKYPSEEGVTPIIQEIVQWCSETIVLLEKPDALTTTSEEEGIVAFPLVWKHHSQEFLVRAELKERQKAAAKTAASSYQGGPGSLLSHDHSHEEEHDELPPVPPLPDSLQGGTGSTHSAGTTGGSCVESTKARSSGSRGASSAMADDKDVPAASTGPTSSPTKAKNEAEAGQNTTQKPRQPKQTVGATEKSPISSPDVGVPSDEGREISNHRAHAHALATPILAPSDSRKRNQSQPERAYGRLSGQYPGNAPDLFPAITFLQGLGKRSSTPAGTPISPADPRSTYRYSPTTTSSPVVDMKKESGDEKAEKTNAPPPSSSKLTPQPLPSKGEPSISDMSDLLAMVNFD
ncbi:hypothetical protein FRC19_003750 [Serendipita sp. 401]|nr:hypothetical protein FRC19_003750 [Serendipita sp. 401]KAG9027344.1 hypothetical protein FS842_004926 [Serendipita sp. 407]